MPDKKTRSLLKDFSIKGISKEDFSELDELVSANSPSMLPLLRYIQNHIDPTLPTVKCPNEWAQLLRALASPSPVCGLVHPSEQLFGVLRQLQSKDITKDIQSMRLLQSEVPVLLGRVNHIPLQPLSQLIEELIEKSLAPFGINSSKSDTGKPDAVNEDILSELSYFPCLPKVRVRGSYSIDRHSSRFVGCTKQSGGHPTLLPGIFTVYCPHGELTTSARTLTGHVVVTLCRNMLWV